MALSLDKFFSLWTIKGGGTPVSDVVDSRPLALIGSGTAPRASSYRRRRGAEFRSATFSATSPRAFATASPGTLHSALYVSSKIRSFTVCAWAKPQKTGVSAFGLTPIGGLFSATNMGATAWVYDQPCFILTDGVDGAGYVIVSAFGSILDTRTATQTVGPTTTTPLQDDEYSFVAVRVTGSPTVNNQVDAVELYTRSQDGVVRVYALGESKAKAAVVVGATIPANNKVLTIQGRARTFKTTLSGTTATGQITYGGAGNATDGETVVVGQDNSGNPLTYTFREYVGSGKRMTAVFQFNNPVNGYSTSTPKTRFLAGGWLVTCLWGTKYPSSGAGGGSLGFGAISTEIGVQAAAKVFDAYQGNYDGFADFLTPASPASGYYDAGRGWADRRVVPGVESTVAVAAASYPREIPMAALSVGVVDIEVMVVEQTAATGAYDLPCTPARLGRNSPYIARLKATTADVISAANAGAGSVPNGAFKYTCTFLRGTKESVEQNPTSHTVAAGPRAVSLTTIPIGPTGTTARRIYRTLAGGSVYYFLALINDNTTTTYSDTTSDVALAGVTTFLPTTCYMTGGAAAAGTRSVKIGASWADTRDNLIKAINATGTPGTEYSADITTANPSCSAAAAGNNIALTSKYIGSAGNGKPLSESVSCLSGVTAFSGGGSGVDDEVLIGASVDEAWQNMADAINQTGATGLVYGTDGSLPVDAYVTASYSDGRLLLTSKESGATGTGRTVSTDATGATVKDAFSDKTLTALYGGKSAPPFSVSAGARPDNSDLRFVLGWGTT